MDTKPSTPGPGLRGQALVVTRVADGQWHVLDDDLVAGRGHAVRRPDGRLFVSIDAWHEAAFDQLAAAMVAELPAPLHTLVDEADRDAAALWHRVGFTVRRREWEFVVPTDPTITGLATLGPPPGVRIVPAGEADEGLLRTLDQVIREQIEAGIGWQSMPAQIRARPEGTTIVDPSRYTVAAAPDRYLGMLRLATATRRPRIGLLAVRADEQRRGIARALLADVLGALHRRGTATASAEIDESNAAALALFEGIGGRRTNRTLELAR